LISTAHRVRLNDGIEGKDAVGLYLDGIAKTPLLTAAEEVELARQIEAGQYARALLEDRLTTEERPGHKVRASRDELELIAEEGDRAMQRFITANLRLVVSVARKYEIGRAHV